MTKLNYLNNLLVLCTKKQKDLFQAIYPKGVSPKQVNWAIQQVENTLKSSNEEKSNLKNEVKLANANTNKYHKKVTLVEHELVEVKLNLAKLQLQFTSLPGKHTPINSQTQERLDLLNALEAGGVDNWEWYEQSIEDYHQESST